MIYLQVKNWRAHQHYKDRSPPWIKLHRSLLDDYDFSCLQDASKLLLVLIWVLASQSDGRIPDDPKYLQKKLGLGKEPDTKPLIDGGFLIPEQDASSTLAERLQVAPRGEDIDLVEKKEKGITLQQVHDFKPNGTVRAWAEGKGYLITWDAHLEHFKDYLTQDRNRKRYSDLESAFRTCLRSDWGNLRERSGARTVHGPAQAVKPTTCGNCAKPITGAWSQSPKGRVCDPCWKHYHREGTWK